MIPTNFSREKFLMFYDKTKTLSENSLVVEQLRFFGPIMPLHTSKVIYDYFMTWDYHDWLDLASVAALIVPYAGPALSIGIDLINAYTLQQEGRQYEASLRYMLSVIPGGILLSKFPWVKKYGTENLIKLVRFASGSKKVKLTKEQFKALEKLKESQKALKSEAEKATAEILIQSLKLSIEKSTIISFIRILKIFKLKLPKIFFTSEVIAFYYGIKWTYPRLATLLGIEYTPTPNTLYGFKEYCKFMGILFISFDNKNKIGVGKTDTGNLKFIYDKNKKTFLIQGSDKIIADKPIGDEFSENFIDEVRKIPGGDSIMLDIFNYIGNENKK